MKIINVRITDKQDAKIRSSGMNYSEYVRRSIDFYDLRREDALIHSKIDMIDRCMDELKKLKESEFDNMLKVNGLYKNIENVNKSDEEMLYNNHDNQKNNRQDNLYNTYKNYLPLLSKMLNIHNCIPGHVKKKVKEETCTTSREFDGFIHKYREIIKQEKYEFGHDKVVQANIV